MNKLVSYMFDWITDLAKLVRIAFTPLSGCRNAYPERKSRKYRKLKTFSKYGKTFLVLCLISTFCGCINIYTRCPGTDSRIDYCYQSTDTAGAATLIGSFPQMMVPTGDRGLEWYNIFTVTLIGVPCFVDTVCEAALDTVFYPIDYFIVKERDKSREGVNQACGLR